MSRGADHTVGTMLALPLLTTTLLGAGNAAAKSEPHVKWTAPWPNPEKPAAGLPVVEGTQHFRVHKDVTPDGVRFANGSEGC